MKEKKHTHIIHNIKKQRHLSDNAIITLRSIH